MESEHNAAAEGRALEELLSFDEAVKVLDTSKSTLYRLLNQEDIKGVKVGKQWRFRKADLVAYLQRSPVVSAFNVRARADLDSELEFFRGEWSRAAIAQDLVGILDSDRNLTPEARIESLANFVVMLAVVSTASDIHISPTDTNLRLRYRIDGVLHDIRRMPMSLHDSLITRFKEMAEMNLVEKRLPQDGRARFTCLEPENVFDLRMSVLPTFYGENVVIRILNRTNVLLGLDRIESTPTELNAIRNWMHQPSGMIVATGPTGSGKSTMLYSCLRELDGERANILTVEDPIEHLIPNITQIQVNRRAGLTFAAAMRSFLRQDPDVILCREFRDLEITELAIEAAVTGHVVLGALHTEDAVTALLRLVDIGIARHLIPATLIGVVALRLARKLCTHCKVEASNKTAEEKMARVRRLAMDGGYVVPEDAVFYSSLGCEKCRRTGYRGRIGLYDILTCAATWALQVDRLLKKCDTAEEMKRLAVQSGMRTLLADGICKAVAGETSVDEALRVADIWM